MYMQSFRTALSLGIWISPTIAMAWRYRNHASIL
jgi:hypothetical protein